MMKKYRVILLVIVLCSISGCKVGETISSSLSESQNACLKYNKTVLDDMIGAYQFARSYNNVNHTIDSIITSISRGKEQDTIFVIEGCNPPSYSYYAIIWNKDNAFTVWSSDNFEKRIFDEEDEMLLRLIERWDKDEIISRSHEKPLIYRGNWFESRIANRIVMSQGKCEAVESMLFSAINFDLSVTPLLIE